LVNFCGVWYKGREQLGGEEVKCVGLSNSTDDLDEGLDQVSFFFRLAIEGFRHLNKDDLKRNIKKPINLVSSKYTKY
jgi:hypothetical protein